MIGEVLEGIIEFIVEILFRILIEIICFYTGEAMLSVVTFGKKKVRWNYYADESITKAMLLTDVSVIVGLVFWVISIAIFAKTIN